MSSCCSQECRGLKRSTACTACIAGQPGQQEARDVQLLQPQARLADRAPVAQALGVHPSARLQQPALWAARTSAI